MKKLIVFVLTTVLVLSFVSASALADSEKAFTIGICNFVDDASLNQIIANIRNRLKEVEA